MTVHTSKWLLRIPSAEAEGRVFCFPYSGVGASMFNRWPRWIGPFEVCPIQLPGRENRVAEPHFRTYPRLAGSLADEFHLFLDRPFIFFGHCAGALPAYETARLLAGRELPSPRRLVVSAQVAPHDCPHDRFLELGDADLTAELARVVTLRGGQPHPDLLELSLAVLHADLEASRSYGLAEPAPVPMDITVVHWAGDPEVTRQELAGWACYASEVDFVVMDGGHYSFLTPPEELLSLLAARLRKGTAR